MKTDVQILKRVSVILVVLSSQYAFSQETAAPWLSRASVRQIIGDGVGHTDSLTQLNWFLPLNPNAVDTMWFADLGGTTYAGHGYGATAGMGYRWFLPDQNRIYGLNAYWDMREESDLLFNQAGIGLETLGEVFDFRVNGYTPTVNDSSQYLPFSFSGNNLIFRELNAFSGVDYECAINLPGVGPIQSSVAGGGYYFDASNSGEAAGWRVRADVAFEDTIAAAFVVQDDDLFGRTYNLFVEIRSLLKHRANPIRQSMAHRFRNDRGTGDGQTIVHRLADPVRRQPNIVLKRREQIATDTSGTPLTFVHVVPGAAGDGRFETPYGTIAAAMADALAPTSVVFTPEGGTFNENVTLVAGTRLLSNGPTQTVISSEGGLALPLSGVGSDLTALPASIVGDVALADDTEFSGFDVTGGVSGVGLMNVNVNNTAVGSAPADAFSFTGSDGISLSSIAISMPGGRGILLDDTSATLDTVAITNAADDGIQIDTGAIDRTVTLTDLTVTNAGMQGIDANSAGAGNLTLAVSSTTSSSAGDGINVTSTGAGDTFLSIDQTSVASDTGAGFVADGSAAAGTLFLNRFESNIVTAADMGGVVLNTVTFDSDSLLGGNQQVDSTTLGLGSSTSRLSGNGVSLTDITGDWNMGVASIFNTMGTGLAADNSGLAMPFSVSSLTGSSVDTTVGSAIELNTVTSGLVFDSITSNNSATRGIGLTNVTGRLDSGVTTVSASTMASLRYEAIVLPDLFTADLGATTINSTISNVVADNIEKVGVTDGLTEVYTPLTINGP